MDSVNLEITIAERTIKAAQVYGEDIVSDVKIARCFCDSTEELISSYRERCMNSHAECAKQIFE